MTSTCIDDLECGVNEFCYDQFGCDCNFLRGYKGENCDEAGPGVIFTLTLSGIELFIGLILLLRLLYLYKYLNHTLVYWLDYNCRNLYLLTFGLLAFFFWRIVTLVIVQTPNDNVLPPNFEKYHRLFPVETVAIGLLVSFITLITGNIGNLWLEKGVRMQHNSTIEFEKKKKWLNRFITGFNIAQGLWILTYLVVLFLNAFYATLGALCYLVLHSLLLIYSYIKIRSLLKFCIKSSTNLDTLRAYKKSMNSKKLQSEMQRLKSYVKILTFTGVGLFVSFTTFVIGAGMFAFFVLSPGGWRAVSAPDRVNPVILTVEVVSVSTLIFFWIASYFCHSSFQQLDAVRLRKKTETPDELSEELETGEEEEPSSYSSTKIVREAAPSTTVMNEVKLDDDSSSE